MRDLSLAARAVTGAPCDLQVAAVVDDLMDAVARACPLPDGWQGPDPNPARAAEPHSGSADAAAGACGANGARHVGDPGRAGLALVDGQNGVVSIAANGAWQPCKGMGAPAGLEGAVLNKGGPSGMDWAAGNGASGASCSVPPPCARLRDPEQGSGGPAAANGRGDPGATDDYLDLEEPGAQRWVLPSDEEDDGATLDCAADPAGVRSRGNGGVGSGGPGGGAPARALAPGTAKAEGRADAGSAVPAGSAGLGRDRVPSFGASEAQGAMPQPPPAPPPRQPPAPPMPAPTPPMELRRRREREAAGGPGKRAGGSGGPGRGESGGSAVKQEPGLGLAPGRVAGSGQEGKRARGQGAAQRPSAVPDAKPATGAPRPARVVCRLPCSQTARDCHTFSTILLQVDATAGLPAAPIRLPQMLGHKQSPC